MQCPQISDEKKILPLWQITFDPLKNGLKIFISKTCIFFIRNLRALHLFFAGTYIRIWGHLFSAGIALQLYSALRFERLKRVQKSRAIPWDFWDEVFSLSMSLVCPHLTTVYFCRKCNFHLLWPFGKKIDEELWSRNYDFSRKFLGPEFNFLFQELAVHWIPRRQD